MDKAVILARGLGTRMRKHNDQAQVDDAQAAAADAGVKAMIPIDRPFLDYVLHNLAQAGYKHICLVIGPEHDAMRDYYGRELRCKRLTIDFAIQQKPLGTADAVLAAESFAGRDPFLVINSDNFYPLEALTRLRELKGPGLAGFERDSMLTGNIPADRVVKFAVIKTDETGYMTRIIEKPGEDILAGLAKPICLSMNCWRFGPEIFTACRSISLSPRGEFEIPDAVQCTIDKLGQRYKNVLIRAAVLDLSSRDDIAPVAKALKGMVIDL
jgi:dTDP-glucose pyrophosphorylase